MSKPGLNQASPVHKHPYLPETRIIQRHETSFVCNLCTLLAKFKELNFCRTKLLLFGKVYVNLQSIKHFASFFQKATINQTFCLFFPLFENEGKCLIYYRPTDIDVILPRKNKRQTSMSFSPFPDIFPIYFPFSSHFSDLTFNIWSFSVLHLLYNKYAI